MARADPVCYRDRRARGGGLVIWALIATLVIVCVVAERRWVSHMRRETVRSVWSRRTGGSYRMKPWANSGWFVVAVVVLVAVIFLMVIA